MPKLKVVSNVQVQNVLYKTGFIGEFDSKDIKGIEHCFDSPGKTDSVKTKAEMPKKKSKK